MAFEQATIAIVKSQEFGTLKAAIERTFAADQVESFLSKLEQRSMRVRNFDGVLGAGLLNEAGAKAIYDALPVSDQAQIREFYLTRLEAVSEPLRHKYKQVYRYS